MKIVQQSTMIETNEKELRRLIGLLVDYGLDSVNHLKGIRKNFVEKTEGGKERAEERAIARIKETIHFLYELGAVDKIILLANHAHYKEVTDICEYAREKIQQKSDLKEVKLWK